MANVGGRKLKILCLHGYRQNADSFHSKLGAFRKLSKRYAELVVVSAPHVVPSDPEAVPEVEPEADQQRAWWFTKKEPNSFNAHHKTDDCYGYDLSLELIRKTIEQMGPFDGLLGFSQGAAMVALLCGLQQCNELHVPPFRFAILFAGFRSGSSAHHTCYRTRITIQSLHVIGRGDKVIPSEMSEELLEDFESAQTLFHAGGHFIAASAQEKAVYIQFLQKQLTAMEHQQ